MQYQAGPNRPAHYLREWRKHSGLMLKQLAEDVGSSIQNLSNIENMRTRLGADIAERIARRLGITPDDLRSGPPSEGAGLEIELVRLFRSAKVQERRLIVDLARVVVRNRTHDGEPE